MVEQRTCRVTSEIDLNTYPNTCIWNNTTTGWLEDTTNTIFGGTHSGRPIHDEGYRDVNNGPTTPSCTQPLGRCSLRLHVN